MELARTSGVEDLTNIEVFLVAREVEESLARKDISKCLAWCHDNKSRLRKLKSNLEFQVGKPGTLKRHYYITELLHYCISYITALPHYTITTLLHY